MNLKLHAWRLSGTTEYPVWSIAIALVLIALSLFLPVYLCYVAFVICMYRIVCYDAKVFATDYCLLIPWARLFRTAGGMTLLVWLCLIAAIWYLIRGKLRANTALVILILLLNYLLLRMNMAVNNFGLCFGQLCVLFVLLPQQDADSAERAAKTFVGSLLICAVYALIFRNTPQMLAVRGPESLAIWGTNFKRFSGIEEDPNYYSTIVIVALALLCKLKETGRLHSLSFWIGCAILAVVGALTYSKMYLLVLVLLGGIYIIWQFWNKKMIKGVVFSVTAVVASMYLLFAESSPFAVIMTRLTTAENLSDFTTHRSEVLVWYWDAVTENLGTFLLGYGMQADWVHGKSAHNIFMEITYYTGVVGLILILAFWASIIKMLEQQHKEIKKQGILAKYIVIFILAVLYMALQGMFQVITHAGVFLAFLSVYLLPKRQEKAGNQAISPKITDA